MAELALTPYAPAFIESMRAVGYSLEAAVADLIDNSISAGATLVRVQFRPFDDPYVAIIDNGEGMGPDELTEAMRHGGRSPLEVRSPHDLGRFGLGLKTASLSQCRRLIVVSQKDGRLSARCWDLDLVAQREAWVLWVPDTEAEIMALPHVGEIVEQGRGTVVLWQDLDRLAAGEASVEQALGEKMDRVRDHLALVFHRYLSGEPGIGRLGMEINDNPVLHLDPFLSLHKATQPLYEDVFEVEGSEIRVQPYILPHISKLSRDELKLAGGEEGLRRNQGFYVYRNRRLIIRGTWFRLARAEELTKLARVRVDIPNALDHLWTLDIKKSAAHPPEIVRRNLGRTVERIAERSRQTYTFRGRNTRRDGIIHAWNRIQGRDGISYRVNREHPAVAMLDGALDDDQRQLLRGLLETIESTYPADALYADIASDRPRATERCERDSLRDLALQMLDAAGSVAGARDSLLANLHLVEPFCSYPEITGEIVKEIQDAD
ncbi:MAG: ATP-binding protein [Nitrospirae bacterium]|nr:ATP-binding protein [Nitrospirota bacterium]